MRLMRLLSVFFIAGWCVAVLAQSWGGNEPTSVQVYRDADDTTMTLASNTQAEQQQQAAATVSATQAPPVQFMPQQSQSFIASHAQNNAQSIVLLQQQLEQLNQNFLLFQQQDNDKIEALSAAVKGVQAQQKQLGQVLMMLSKELGELKQLPQSKPLLSDTMLYQALAAMVLMMLMTIVIVWRLCRRKQQKIDVSAKTDEDTQDEYDYMGSDESIPAKLNLARAYIAMEDYPAAKTIIAEILSIGDDEQCQEAAALERDIPSEAGD